MKEWLYDYWRILVRNVQRMDAKLLAFLSDSIKALKVILKISVFAFALIGIAFVAGLLVNVCG